MNIRLFKPCLGEEELKNIKDSFDRAWIGLGPKVSEFENEWSKYIGCKSSIGLNSATAALHLAIASFKFPEGKKVLVPAITFASTAFAPIYNGLEPVFVDVDENTISISLDDLEKKYTKDCVAIIPVHLGGHPAQMDKISEFAKIKNLKIVEDCAHTAGSSYKGKKLGLWGDIGCFSFEEKKAMTTGDGGMMCSDDEELIAPMKACRWVGIDKDTWKRVDGYTDTKSSDARHWYYEIASLGFKYNMNDLSASIGLAQLKKLDWMNSIRSKHINRYMDGIEGLTHIKPLMPFEPERNSYWLFGVRCEKRDELILHLKTKGIATGVHYLPLMLFPYFKKWDNGCPISKRIWNFFITLPLFVELTEKEIDYIINALVEFDAKKY
jgi:perosamine synthetase